VAELPRIVEPVASPGHAACSELKLGAAVVTATVAKVFFRTQVTPEPMALLPTGTAVVLVAATSDWRLARFRDPQWGERAGYINCADLDNQIVPSSSVKMDSAQAGTPAAPPTVQAAPTQSAAPGLRIADRTKRETFNGYVEWSRDGVVIVDGQRVEWTAANRFKLGKVRTPEAIPLGYEAKVRGKRATDGTIVADEFETSPNGMAMFETEVVSATNAMENGWLKSGQMLESGPGRRPLSVGRIVDEGPAAERVRSIVQRLVPPYVNVSSLRVHVVETNEWNAAAMGNGAIWVYSGLVDSSTDDELAVVLGHELAHYTHEHTRRTMKRGMWAQLIAAGAEGAMRSVRNNTTRQAVGLAASLSLSAWTSGYSRELEDQADRVGLRYAHEAGFDVSAGPGLWARMRSKYGELDRVSSFFFGSHSRPTERIRNIQLELARNYSVHH
jgi:Zn-dependent protease with chaperone function